jgi:hypothetical protein
MDYFFYPQVPASYGVIVLVRTAASCSAPYAYKPGYSNSSLPLNKSMVMETGQPANRGKVMPDSNPAHCRRPLIPAL